MVVVVIPVVVDGRVVLVHQHRINHRVLPWRQQPTLRIKKCREGRVEATMFDLKLYSSTSLLTEHSK